jgi:hypothetical protein
MADHQQTMQKQSSKRVNPTLSDSNDLDDILNDAGGHSASAPSIISRPIGALVWMSIFLVVLTALAAVVFDSLKAAFANNPAFNGLIVGVLFIGVLITFRQVIDLFRERAWIEDFRRKDPERPTTTSPRLLAPMARMLGRREGGQFSLSAMSLRSLLDSIHSRLDESRDLARYLIGLLIFLGLLGTFWGLLATIGDVGQVIGGLDVAGGEESAAIFERLKRGLEGPLAGMGIAFSSSLFGLAGSLILGFLDLQAGHSQNRFFNELEEWLSGATRLSSGSLAGDGDAGVPAYVQALLEQTADSLDRLQRSMADQANQRSDLERQLTTLNHNLGDLARGMGSGQLNDELRDEFRLLNRTLARALSERGEK